MAATARRKITLTYFGDVGGSAGFAQEISASDNNPTPAQIQIVTLAIGDNTITAPSAGATPRACTIVKPTANAVAIKLKGSAGDVGIQLHKTDPDTISIDGVASFVLNAGAELVGIRLFWT